jgi:hypothetical protein
VAAQGERKEALLGRCPGTGAKEPREPLPSVAGSSAMDAANIKKKCQEMQSEVSRFDMAAKFFAHRGQDFCRKV